MKKWFWALWLPLLAWANEAPPGAPGDTVQQALAEARARHAPIFVDFHAAWCHNCYFMQKNVMTGPEWEAVKQRAVVIELDGDSPEGGYWFNQWKVGGYPTYVVLDENGGEIGRILGDRPRAKFYQELNPILERGAALETYTTRVKGSDAESVSAAREVLRTYYERENYQAALDWFAALPETQQAGLRKDSAISARLQRLQLLRAAPQKNPDACLQAAAPVLNGALTCDLLVEFSALQSCLKGLPEAEQRAQLKPYQKQFSQLQDRVLISGLGECADTRGVVETAADFHEKLGDQAAFKQVLEQGIRYSEQRLKLGKDKKLDVRRDRGLADNLRFYFERLGDAQRLDALMIKLVVAYPKDYVYAFRLGRSLARRGKYEKALPLLQNALPRSYGRNRLWVEQWRAYTLAALKREDEARKNMAATLQANGPWFPNEVEKLKAAAAGTAPDTLKL